MTISNLFLQEKKDGTQRPIFNVKRLNHYVQYTHFNMEGLFLVKSLLREKDWMIKLDLKDAYHCVLMHEEHRKYLHFKLKTQIYEFGLASAPRDFTKLMKPAIGLLRRLGMRMIIYLDDMLMMNEDQQALLEEGKTTCYLLQCLGFVINQEKSEMSPKQ